MSISHLKNIDFPERTFITEEIKLLLLNPKNDAYSLSLILLMIAPLGNESLYEQTLENMTLAMEELESSPFKTWLYGRMLFAAQSIHDEKRIDRTKKLLKSQLKALLKKDDSRFDRSTVWALGYLTALDQVEYNQFKESMVNAANHVTQDVRSDNLWTWIMIVQAAAHASDTLLYEHSLAQIMTISQQSSISQALTKGLLRTEASNDYPAWAIAIVRLAAQAIADEAHYHELERPLAQAIQEAHSTGKIQEYLLALVSAQLAIEREHHSAH